VCDVIQVCNVLQVNVVGLCDVTQVCNVLQVNAVGLCALTGRVCMVQLALQTPPTSPVSALMNIQVRGLNVVLISVGVKVSDEVRRRTRDMASRRDCVCSRCE